jgi:hypothetical protein
MLNGKIRQKSSFSKFKALPKQKVLTKPQFNTLRSFNMSVRATGSLIGDTVYVTAIPNSPKMTVVSVDAEAKQVTTVWFSDSREAQQAVFPSSALDRVEIKTPPAPAKKAVAGAKPGRKKK